MDTPDDIALAHSWLNAARRHEVSAALQEVYHQVAQEVESRAPACWASGRCCNFAKAGHRLYVTGLEAAYLAVNLPAAGRPDAAITLPQAAASPIPACSFLHGNLCSVHTIKPLACRTYFCDARATEWQQELTERGLERIRALHDTHAIAYRYAEWGWMLDLLARASPRTPL